MTGTGVQWFGNMMVFELMCGKLYCGGRCYMPKAGSPLCIRTHKDVQNLTEAKYPCSERRLVFMDAVLYFAMRDHLPFGEPVPFAGAPIVSF